MAEPSWLTEAALDPLTVAQQVQRDALERQESRNEVLYHMHPKAAEELHAFTRTTINQRRLGLIDSDRARLLIREKQRYLWAQARAVAEPDRPVQVTCAGCKRKHIMPASTTVYRCPCSSQDRTALTDRVALT